MNYYLILKEIADKVFGKEGLSEKLYKVIERNNKSPKIRLYGSYLSISEAEFACKYWIEKIQKKKNTLSHLIFVLGSSQNQFILSVGGNIIAIIQ